MVLVNIIFSSEKIDHNSPANKLINNCNDIITYEKTMNIFLDITNDICGLLNGEGGVIFLGVNKSKFCVGCTSDFSMWTGMMENLGKFFYGRIVNNKNTKFWYKITIYQVIGNKNKYMSKIEVRGEDKDYYVNNSSTISRCIRMNDKTVVENLNEEQMKEFGLDAIQNGMVKIGERYGEEGCDLEFKLSFMSLLKSKDGIGKYISSFGNSNGGKLVIGVNDDGIIEGVKIDNWDKIQRDVLGQQHAVNNVNFLNRISMRRIYLKKNGYYLVEINIPKSDEVILVKDNGGSWNKWVRVMSCSIKDDRQILYTQKQYSEVEKKFIIAESLKGKLERENDNMKKTIETLIKNNNEKVVQLENENANLRTSMDILLKKNNNINEVIIQLEDDKEALEKYSSNVLGNYMKMYENKYKQFQSIGYIIPTCIMGIILFGKLLI